MITRRQFTRNALIAIGSTSALGFVSGCDDKPASKVRIVGHHDASLDATIPKAAKLRVVARSGEQVANSDYIWHGAPDGGACFATEDQGWIYVSNSELGSGAGGVGAIRFSKEGEIVDAYSLLTGTTRNCAGGKTPWQTWLTCEESGDTGQVYECDPFGRQEARVRPAMGSFNHEAAAVDPETNQIYLTEDSGDGCLYRFTPAAGHDLSSGKLEVAVTRGMSLRWALIQDPEGHAKPTRYQVPEAARFVGDEGIVFNRQLDGTHVYFTTKGDNRVWDYHINANRLSIVYDASLYANPVLTGVDNIEITPDGELLVAEDGGDMQIVAIGRDNEPTPLVMLHNQPDSEIAGPAFSPNGAKLYFSSQWGPEGSKMGGITYELTY